MAGDADRSKQMVIALVEKMGFDAVYAGPLSESWRYQPGTPAYCPDPTIQQLPLLLRRAERNKSNAESRSGIKNHGGIASWIPTATAGASRAAFCRFGYVEAEELDCGPPFGFRSSLASAIELTPAPALRNFTGSQRNRV